MHVLANWLAIRETNNKRATHSPWCCRWCQNRRQIACVTYQQCSPTAGRYQLAYCFYLHYLQWFYCWSDMWLRHTDSPLVHLLHCKICTWHRNNKVSQWALMRRKDLSTWQVCNRSFKVWCGRQRRPYRPHSWHPSGYTGTIVWLYESIWYMLYRWK